MSRKRRPDAPLALPWGLGSVVSRKPMASAGLGALIVEPGPGAFIAPGMCSRSGTFAETSQAVMLARRAGAGRRTRGS